MEATPENRPEGRRILIVATHSAALAATLDRRLRLDNGRLVEA